MFETFSEAQARLAIFLGVFAVMALLEIRFPRRRLVMAKLGRWITNLSIVGLGALTVRLLGWIAQPLVAVGAAWLAAERGWGLFNMLSWPGWLELVLALLLLDFAIWLQHLLSHRIAMLWQVHRMHHADRDIDVTTALRFHPIEIGLSMLYKVVWVLVFGPSVVAVIAFEAILNACAMFNHANVALPLRLDAALRTVLVTPDMHRVHHSVERREHHANFGFNLSIWDRLFGTYVAQPAAGHDAMTIGLPAYQDEKPSELGWSLGLPLKRD